MIKEYTKVPLIAKPHRYEIFASEFTSLSAIEAKSSDSLWSLLLRIIICMYVFSRLVSLSIVRD